MLEKRLATFTSRHLVFVQELERVRKRLSTIEHNHTGFVQEIESDELKKGYAGGRGKMERVSTYVYIGSKSGEWLKESTRLSKHYDGCQRPYS